MKSRPNRPWGGVLALALASCQELPPSQEFETMLSAVNGTTGIRLAHATSLPPELSCSYIGVSKGTEDWVPIRRTTVSLMAGEKILLDGHYAYDSTAYKQVGSTVKFSVSGPLSVSFPPQNGENHMGPCPLYNGFDFQCESQTYGGTGEQVVIDHNFLFSVSVSGSYTITQLARAYSSASDTPFATPCPSTWPKCTLPGSNEQQTCRLAVGSGSYLDVWRLHPESLEVRGAGDIRIERGQSYTFFRQSLIVPPGANRVDVTSTFGTTIDNGWSNTVPTNFKVRLAMQRNDGAITYFPSELGRSYSVYKEKHHKVVNLSGALSGLSPGEKITTWSELYEIQNGPWVDINFGDAGEKYQQANLVIWPSPTSGGGCTPTTCAAQGANCGTVPDGCGGALYCGACTSPQTCGGGGTPNVCGGGCTNGYVDADGDGYGAGAYGCYTGSVSSTGGDCCDSDANARPGQTTGFSGPNACGSWDYNCSGAIELTNGGYYYPWNAGGAAASYSNGSTCTNGTYTGFYRTPSVAMTSSNCGQIVKIQPCSWSYYQNARCSGLIGYHQCTDRQVLCK